MGWFGGSSGRPAEEGPVIYGVHSEITERYGVSPGEEEPYTSIGALQNENEGRFVYGFSEVSKDMKDLKAGDKITIEGSSGRWSRARSR